MSKKKKTTQVNIKTLRKLLQSIARETKIQPGVAVALALVLVVGVFVVGPQVLNYFSSQPGEALPIYNGIGSGNTLPYDLCNSYPPKSISIFQPTWPTVGGSAQRDYKQTRGMGFADYSTVSYVTSNSISRPIITAFDSLVFTANMPANPVRFIDPQTLAIKYDVPIGDKYDNSKYIQTGGVAHNNIYFGILKPTVATGVTYGAIYAIAEELTNKPQALGILDLDIRPGFIMDTGKGLAVVGQSGNNADPYYQNNTIAFFSYDLALQGSYYLGKYYSSGSGFTVIYNNQLATDCAGRIWLAVAMNYQSQQVTGLLSINSSGKAYASKIVPIIRPEGIVITDKRLYLLADDFGGSLTNSIGMQVYNLSNFALLYEQPHPANRWIEVGQAYNYKTKILFSLVREKVNSEIFLRAYDVSKPVPVLKWEKQVVSGGLGYGDRCTGMVTDANDKIYLTCTNGSHIYLEIYTNAGDQMLKKELLNLSNFELNSLEQSLMDKRGYLYFGIGDKGFSQIKP